MARARPQAGECGPTVERVHVWFIGAALGFALLGGLLLAITLPPEAALGERIDAQ